MTPDKKSNESSDDSSPKKQDIHNTITQIRTTSAILVVLVVILAVLFLVFSLSGEIRSGPPTLEELYQQTISGHETENNFLYNGYAFIHDGFFWIVRVAKGVEGTELHSEFNIPFYYNPRQVEDVAYQPGARNALLGKDIIYLTQDQEQPAEISLAAIEVGRILGQRYGLLGIPTHAAVTSGAPSGHPQVTCDNVSASVGVLYFVVGDENRVYEEDGCVIVEGQTPSDVVRSADKLAFVMLNIIEDPTPFEPQEPEQTVEPIKEQVIGDYNVGIYGVVARDVVHGGTHEGFNFQDVAQGEFYIAVMQITNLANETRTFTPGVFSMVDQNQTVTVNYQKQRFLRNKLELTNRLNPGQTKDINVLFDMTENKTEVDFKVRFLGTPEQTFTLPVIR